MKKKNVVKKSGDIVRMMKGNIQVVAWHDKRKVMVATTGHKTLKMELFHVDMAEQQKSTPDLLPLRIIAKIIVVLINQTSLGLIMGLQ